jgi:hypothetical protein
VRSTAHRIPINSRPSPISFSPLAPADISRAQVHLRKLARRAYLAHQAAALKASEEGK